MSTSNKNTEPVDATGLFWVQGRSCCFIKWQSQRWRQTTTIFFFSSNMVLQPSPRASSLIWPPWWAVGFHLAKRGFPPTLWGHCGDGSAQLGLWSLPSILPDVCSAALPCTAKLSSFPGRGLLFWNEEGDGWGFLCSHPFDGDLTCTYLHMHTHSLANICTNTQTWTHSHTVHMHSHTQPCAFIGTT